METLFRPAVDEQDPFEDMTPKQIRAYEASRLRLIKTLDRYDAYILRCPVRVKAYIDKHPLTRKNIDFFVAYTLIYKEELQSLFKRTYQVTIRAYQYQKRMEAAARMLREGRWTLKAIASRCGYRNVNNFSRAFKKKMKLTPTQYLNRK